MNVYRGEFAELYDLFYAEKPYDDEVEFTDALLHEHAHGSAVRLLDLACGTGQHAVRFAARGWDVVGVDRSADMIQRAREREGGGGVAFIEQDMRLLDLGSMEFDAAVCLFDSIGYAVTNEAILQTLAAVRRHLRAGGLFALEFWHAPAMLERFDPIRVREWETPSATVLRISRTELDVVAATAEVAYTIYSLRKDGSYGRWNEVHENRYFLVKEMALLLELAGFEPFEWHPGFDASGTVDASTWHVLVLARAVAGNSG